MNKLHPVKVSIEKDWPSQRKRESSDLSCKPILTKVFSLPCRFWTCQTPQSVSQFLKINQFSLFLFFLSLNTHAHIYSLLVWFLWKTLTNTLTLQCWHQAHTTLIKRSRWASPKIKHTDILSSLIYTVRNTVSFLWYSCQNAESYPSWENNRQTQIEDYSTK